MNTKFAVGQAVKVKKTVPFPLFTHKSGVVTHVVNVPANPPDFVGVNPTIRTEIIVGLGPVDSVYKLTLAFSPDELEAI